MSMFRSEAHRHAGRWVMACNWCVYGAQACILPHMTRYYDLDLGLSDTQIGLLMALPALFALMIQPVWGYIADRVMSRTAAFRVVAVLAAASLVGFAFSYQAGGFPLLLISVIIATMTYRVTSPLLSSLTLSYLGAGKRHYFGRIRVFGSMSFTVTVALLCPLAVMLSSWLGFYERTLVFLMGAVFLVVALLTTAWDPDQFEPHQKPQSGAFLALIQQTHLLHFFVAIFLVGVGGSAGIQYIGPFVDYQGLSEFYFGSLWVVGVGTEIVLTFTLHSWIRKVGFQRMVTLGLLAEGLRWVGMSMAGAPWLYLTLFAFHGPAVVGIFFASAMYLDSQCSESIRSTAQTCLMVSLSGGHIAGYWLASQLVASYSMLPRAEAIQVAFLAFGGIALLASFYCGLMVTPEEPEPLAAPAGAEEALQPAGK